MIHFNAGVCARIDAVEDIVDFVIIREMETLEREHGQLGSASARLPGSCEQQSPK